METDRNDAPPAVAGDEGRQTEERIVALLTAHGVRFRVHEHPVAATVVEAMDRLPFPPDQFLKTVAFIAKDTGWILAAVRGRDRIDYRKLAAAAGARRADLHQPSPDAIAVALGMAVGGVGPFPPTDGMHVIVDQEATGMDTVYCGIGPNDRTLEIGLNDLIRVVQARVAPIVQVRDPGS